MGDGLLAVYFVEEGLRGYVNTKCEVVIPPIYTIADTFENGVAVASTDGKKFGILRTDGTWALEPVYDAIAYDWNLYEKFTATRNGREVLIDGETYEEMEKNGENESVYAVFPNKLVDQGGWSSFETYLRNPSGEVVAGPYNGISGARWEGGQGTFIVGAGGENLVHVLAETPEGETITYVVAGEDSPQGETDDDGNTILDKYGGLEGVKHGIIDQDGREILPPTYDDIRYMGNGWYFARKENVWGFLTEDGSWAGVCDLTGQALKKGS